MLPLLPGDEAKQYRIMSSNYSANQYENAFSPKYLQNWSPSKPTKQKITTHEGYTQIIANDRGHLLPSVPRSKASPWGTFMSTWEMPLKIPPSRVNLTARTTAAATALTNWIHKDPDLLNACNGLYPEILGKPHDPSSQKTKKKSVTKTVQQAPSPTIIPSSPVIHGDDSNEPASPHPSAGHTPGPQTPNNSPRTPPEIPEASKPREVNTCEEFHAALSDKAATLQGQRPGCDDILGTD
nr:protein Flattop [Meriones unguiculatus]XP_021502738.1 protein Flattop [Meriones unguiculatus]XP_021502739.1 protein Flattop [Meriones unguiculatus]XP_021502740.1 protein Flattop [Meriones unguiculatus]XP_021502741.1 protein Flattop [Meriones unguiculatus]XP_021502742.1 protein Flattop [Meriones unguiculatus]XP_021502743.1 protein Flattop [Meriones unguiculatus]XP_021502744.1 protein Flattop [Meriones unguiculatus]XP_021502745.1 protein Flattop [Meriones unguiculatus]XP_021502746.1 prote